MEMVGMKRVEIRPQHRHEPITGPFVNGAKELRFGFRPRPMIDQFKSTPIFEDHACDVDRFRRGVGA